TYGSPIAADSEVERGEHVIERETVGVVECRLEHRLRDFKTDEVAVGIRHVAAPGDLEHIESKLGLQVRAGIIRIRNFVAEFPSKFRIQQRYRAIDAEWMACIVGCIVRERPERKGVLVCVLRVAQQCGNKSSAPDVVREISEKVRSKRVVAHVLNDAAAVSEGMGSLQISITHQRKALSEHGLDRFPPH